MNILLVLETIADNRVLINLKTCAKCRENIMEMFRIPLEEETSHESLLYKIHGDTKKELKIKFDDFMVMCPVCKDSEEDITCEKVSEDNLELLNKTPVSKIWLVKSI